MNKSVPTAFLLLLWIWSSIPAAANETLLVVGDSLSAAYRIDPAKGWVALLQERLDDEGYGYEVINSSITGDTTRGGLARLPKLLETHAPSILIIELGGNDGLRGIDPNHSRGNLQQMIEMAFEQGTQVLLLGIRLPPNYGAKYTALFESTYARLAEQYQIGLVPFFLVGVFDRPEYMQKDGIHPNVDAQPILLANVWPALQPLLENARQD
jgi:acyl-CoA thioesterase-1